MLKVYWLTWEWPPTVTVETDSQLGWGWGVFVTAWAMQTDKNKIVAYLSYTSM